MSDAVVQRWTRYGHDRLYVRTPAGDRLGYWDNKTATTVLEPGADRCALDAALAAHHAATRPEGSPLAAVALGDRDQAPDQLPQTRTPLDDSLPARTLNAYRQVPAPDTDSPRPWTDLGWVTWQPTVRGRRWATWPPRQGCRG